MRVAILGTGNIGTDLLVKISKSKKVQCTLFAGRSIDSKGIKFAKSLGFNVSTDGIQAIVKDPDICDVVVDCTAAQDHIKHWEICQNLNKKIIDLTPAKLGSLCVPAISDFLDKSAQNINMVTCGGQASVPLSYALSTVHDTIDYIEVVSTIASLSAGPATRRNLDEYIHTTEHAVKKFSGAKNTKAILILNPADPPIYMQTTVYAKIKDPNLEKITTAVQDMIRKIKVYAPGYDLVVAPVLDRNMVSMTVKMIGAGDYLPSYAGNLDIINCAALRVLELIAENDHENFNQ